MPRAPRKPRIAPRKAPVQQRARDTVDVILEATARILVAEGYDRASTNRIALAAGVSIGSLYQYFPSKEALVAALIDRHSAEMLAAFDHNVAHFAEAPLPIAARAIVGAMVAAHAVDPALHSVLVEQIPRVGRLKHIGQTQAYAERVIRSYLEARRSELRPLDLDMAAFVVVQIVEALTHATVLHRPERLEGDALADEIADAVVRYLVPDEPRR
jgi:AcrR family transcriptional regulator